jgi:hypothetical protein
MLFALYPHFAPLNQSAEEEDISRLKSSTDLVPPIKIEWHDAQGIKQGIVLNKQRENEERDMLVASLNEATRLMNVSVSPLCLVTVV